MADHTRVNLRDDVQDMAPRFGMEGIESRFARTNLEMEKGGVSYFRLDPGFRAPFGHTHAEQEEVYVIVSGSARIAVGDEIVDVSELDAVRVAPNAWRGMEAGPDGVEVIAFGAPNTDNKDAEMQQGWWPEG
jgi:mannose-6-phosphate isomerase-like protein (cupin superfamily)